MKAEATPARLPLQGGSPGATVRLHPLLTGEVHAPEALLHRSGRALAPLRAIGVGISKSAWTWIPAPAFLIEHPSAGPLLVDTGLHSAAESDPSSVMGRVASRMYGFRRSRDGSLEAQLEARGIAPAELALVLMTHLDTDHASAIPELPGQTLVVDRREWRAASSPLAFKDGYHRPHIDQPVEWRTVDFDSPESSPYGPFERTLDLFGDGSVRLLSTPGHTVGHQSVLVRLGEREALIAGDAAYTTRTLSEGTLPGLTRGGRKRFQGSLAQIRAFASAQPGALVIPGHDPAAWAALDPLY